MTRAEIEKIRIDDILYNTETNIVVKVITQWGDNKKNIGDNESLSSNLLNKKYGEAIKMADFEKWEYVKYDAPLKVRYNILQERFFELEDFVYSRLH